MNKSILVIVIVNINIGLFLADNHLESTPSNQSAELVLSVPVEKNS